MKPGTSNAQASCKDSACREQLPGMREVQAIEDWSAQNDDEFTPAEAFAYEIDQWARRALFANGFGDY